MTCAFRRRIKFSLLFSGGARVSGSVWGVGGWAGCKLCHPLILVRNREGWAPSQQKNYLGAQTSSPMGCNISIVDLEDCITSPSPGIPSVAILFNPKCCIESSLSVPQMSAKVCPKAQVCLRALINNQAVPSSRPNGPPLMLSSAGQPAVNSGAGMLWCFREKQPKQVGLSPSTSCDHLKGAKKTKRGQFSLTPDCVS